MVDYVLPGNDDAVRSIKVVLGALTNAIVEVNGGTIVDYVSEDESKKNLRQMPEKREAKDKKPVARKEKKEEKPEEVVVKKEIKNEEKEAKEVKKEKEVKIDLNILTVAELRELAKKKEIKGYSKMKKDELIESLK